MLVVSEREDTYGNPRSGQVFGDKVSSRILDQAVETYVDTFVSG